MSGAKEIRSKIRSVKNTQKITKAMEMVSASKKRKAQDRMSASKPYANHIRAVISHLGKSRTDYRHPYMEDRDVRAVGYLVVSTDRGLCGGLNTNTFKECLKSMQEWQSKKVKIKLSLIGTKAEGFFRRYGADVLSTTAHIGDRPSVRDIIGCLTSMLSAFDAGEIDKLFIVSNKFINTMTQEPIVEQLLPLPEAKEENIYAHHWDYIYESNPEKLLDTLLSRYIESQVYQAVVENIACEQAARMVAMKSASDNAGELINKFQLAYNKARQAAITQELSEIVAGAQAV